jgi:acyl-CoA reductase-like NAD-dependent aldehyde dehydrogenase
MLQDQDLISVQEVRVKIEKAHAAWQTYKNFTQEQVDAVVEAVAAKGQAHARRLAEMAVEETGMGNVDDKVAKNLLASYLLANYIRGMKTVGVLREVPEKRLTEIGESQGVVAAICPTTNPTSTVFFKSIIALKAGNAIVLSPHPRAHQSTCTAAKLVAEAAVEAGAPADLVQCILTSTLEATQAMMKHPKTAVILATGGAGMVKAAYSSGKPAFGVGPGNVVVLLDTTADVAASVAQIISGKHFDFGTVCSSEQTIVAERGMRERMLAEFKAGKAFIMNDDQRQAVERTLFVNGTTVRPECVGKSPLVIARMAGISIPEDTSILVAEIGGIGKAHPLSAEKLSPVLALHFVDGFEQALDACEAVLRFGGAGHTSGIYTQDEAKVKRFAARMPSYRVLVNTSTVPGSTGMTTALQPSMTLGCGAVAGNITSDNVGPQHLINIKRVAWGIRRAEDALPPQPAASGVLDRAALVAAVERYLSQKGLTVSGDSVSAAIAAALPAAPAPAPATPVVLPPARPALHETVSGVVDRFLASKPQAEVAAPAGPSCGCGVKPASDPQPAAVEAPAPPAPKVEISDFVCEADVRAAIQRNKKIFIGPRSIVTPAARELAGQDETIVLAER